MTSTRVCQESAIPKETPALLQLPGVPSCTDPVSGALPKGCRLTVLCLTQPSSLNSCIPSLKCLRTLLGFFLVIINITVMLVLAQKHFFCSLLWLRIFGQSLIKFRGAGKTV